MSTIGIHTRFEIMYQNPPCKQPTRDAVPRIEVRRLPGRESAQVLVKDLRKWMNLLEIEVIAYLFQTITHDVHPFIS